MARRLVILGWHNIEPTWSYPGVSPEAGREAFGRQVRWLRRWANVVPLKDALDALFQGRSLPPRAVALTFDDGYLDNVRVAAPVLNAAGMTATFFLVPGFLSGTVPAWWEELAKAFMNGHATAIEWGESVLALGTPSERREAFLRVAGELKETSESSRNSAIEQLQERLAPAGTGPSSQRLFMDWDDARTLQEYGHDVGAHTCSHPILSQESEQDQRAQLVSARMELIEHLGTSVDLLAFPNGRRKDYSDVTLRIASQSGYSYAITTRPGLVHDDVSQFEVPRVLVGPKADVKVLFRGGLRLARRMVTR